MDVTELLTAQAQIYDEDSISLSLLAVNLLKLSHLNLCPVSFVNTSWIPTSASF